MQLTSHKEFLKIDKNYEAAASAADLVYVSDQQPGIRRVKKGKGFTYYYDNKRLRDDLDLKRIRNLVIPPAWTRVWISKSPNGHIQATGYDVRGRKQYRYHPRWNELQQETKFHRMIEFGKSLPLLRKEIKKDLSLPGFPEVKVIAMVVSLMEKTFIRVGSSEYEKLYGSYGLTTLKNKHVSVSGDRVTFSFKGKKGVYHNITLKSKRFAHIIKQCKSISGRELFQYYDGEGNLKKVDSGQVNQYIKTCTGQDFTSKDFRTWAGTLMMFTVLKAAEPSSTARALQQNIVKAFQEVSVKLGNTVPVCKKYYVHPGIIHLYEKDTLATLCKTWRTHPYRDTTHLSNEEQILLKLLVRMKRKGASRSTSELLKASLKKETRRNRMPVPLQRRPRKPNKAIKTA